MTLVFLLKLSLCWGFFALLYVLLLRGETFFRANRIYLLGTVVLGILLALDLHWLPQLPVEAAPLLVLPTITIGLEQAEATVRSWELSDYAWLLYLSGVGLMLLRFCWSVIRLLRMAVRGEAEVLPDGCLLLRSTATTVPFSFFKWIFVPLDFQPGNERRAGDLAAMLTHERAHAQGWHSADVLFMELLCVLFWFHPLVHWYRRSLRTVHEYLADAEASRRLDFEQYGLLLIRQSQPGMPVALVHHFFQSPLKQRFTMLTKKASSRTRTWKYGLLLPLALLFVLLFRQAPAIAQTIESETIEQLSADDWAKLEADKWVRIDTFITFDPNTYKQTMSVIRTDLSPYKEPGTGRQVYQTCEHPPTFPGGEAAMFQFLIDNIRYPAAARADKAEGSVFMRFVVGKDGTLRSIGEKPTRSPMHRDLTDEAKRTIELMPKWIPGEHKGQPVDCEVILPIRFKMD